MRIRTETLYAAPCVLFHLFLVVEVCGLHLMILFAPTVTTSYRLVTPQCSVCGIRVLISAYTVPSFNPSLLSPYNDVQSYTPPRNDQVHEVRSLNTGWVQTPDIYLRTTTTAPTRTAKTCCPTASVRDDENKYQAKEWQWKDC